MGLGRNPAPWQALRHSYGVRWTHFGPTESGQRSSTSAALVYNGPQGPALAVLPDHDGGPSTPHTPKGVAYYLDQAHRATSVGANSAAIAMFRAALEFTLYGPGFTARMLGPKIAELDHKADSVAS
jgi:hypothetical protein